MFKKHKKKEEQDTVEFRKNKEEQDTVEFRKNLDMLTEEYGEDLRGLTLNYGSARMIANLLIRVKHLEEKLDLKNK